MLSIVLEWFIAIITIPQKELGSIIPRQKKNYINNVTRVSIEILVVK